MSEIQTAPSFYRVATPDGIALVVADDVPWPDHIGITDELLGSADPEFLASGDGMVRFRVRAQGRDALYGYAHPDPESPGIAHYDLLGESR